MAAPTPCPYPVWHKRATPQPALRATLPHGEGNGRNGFPRADALGMTYIFRLVYLHGHCEEGPCPDAAIRFPRPFFIIYYLFFILYSFYEPQSSGHGPAKE